MSIPKIPGTNLIPSSINEAGFVRFTDGTSDLLIANQETCEAYGFTYDKVTGACIASPAALPNAKLANNLRNENNNIHGPGNITEFGTNTSYIMGQSNTIKGMSRSNIIVGSNNEIANGVNNSSILGNYGLAQRAGEAVIGGGVVLGGSQSSTITLTGRTEDASATSLFVNGDAAVTIIARDADATATSFTGFEANVMGVRVGGSAAGSVNDRILLRATGLVYLKADNQSVSTLGSHGTVSGWTAAVAFSGTNDMLFQVTGAANMDIKWSCTLNLYEIKT